MKTLLPFVSAIVLALATALPAKADDFSRKHLSNPNGSVAGGSNFDFSKNGKSRYDNGGGSFDGSSKTNIAYGSGSAPKGGGYYGDGPKGGNSGGGISHSAPGPVLGLGLPALIVAGGYVLFRRRARK